MPLEVRPTWAAECHQMLLWLAGRISDQAIARARSRLASGHRSNMALDLLHELLLGDVPLPEADEDLLAELLEADGHDSSPLDDLPPAGPDPLPPPYDFAPLLDGVRGGDPIRDDLAAPDVAAIEAVADASGVRSLWRSWRTPAQSGAQPPKRVYVVEAIQRLDLPRLTGIVQRSLEATGDADPQVETYAIGDQLPLYQRLARSRGRLLWTPQPAPPPLLAPVFDEADGLAGPCFYPHHPRMDLVEALQVADYLWAGEPLLISPDRLDDVLDPCRSKAVPVDFRTDGTWIWTDATTYYLEEYGLEPPSALLAHIRAADYRAPTVDTAARHRAVAFLTGSDCSVTTTGETEPVPR
ncbi:hypothetical protein [Streptomyces sp. NPDC002573]|uniref:hypothetical protein n=1 Tax=Streptomyces sp. NPDC002573 TaxID=3364651 RepID=UPI0036A2BDCC